MRIQWFVPGIALLAGCGGQPEEAPAPARVTGRAKPKVKKTDPKSAKKKRNGFGFGDEAGKGTVEKRTVERKRRMAPSMEELEGAMRVRGDESAPRTRFICERCGTESRTAGSCCSQDRVPVK